MAIKFLNSVNADSGVLYVDAANDRVGIGTTSPSDILSVNSSSTETILHLTNTSTGTATSDGLRIGLVGASAYFLLRENANMLFHTNNTERMRINSSGNVGIGTTSPDGKLHIYGGAGEAKLVMTHGTTDHLSGIIGTNGGGFAVEDNNFFAIWHQDIANVGTETGLTERMRITSAGNVGIGTTSPARKLQVGDGTADDRIRVYFSDNTYTEQTGYGMEFSRPASYIRPLTDNINNLYIGQSTKTWATLQTDATSHSFNNNGSTLMYIASAGNVGIGTTSPSSKLEVSDTTAPTLTLRNSGANPANAGMIRFIESTNTDGFQLTFDGSDNKLKFISDSSGTTSTRMVIERSNGNVGIGTTSPAQKLEVSFAASVYGARFTRNDAAGSSMIEFANNAGVKSIVGYDAGVDGYRIGTPTANNLTVKQAGNVGIGTTSPSYKLDVSGDIRSSGAFRGVNIALSGYIDLTGHLNHRSNVRVLNKLGTNWLTWATRDTSGSDSKVVLSNVKGDISQFTNDSGYLTSYTETQTLDDVTTLGSTTTNNISIGPNFLVGEGISTTPAYLQLGSGRTASGYAYIDFVGDTTYTDYGLRVIRYNGGANTASDIVHRGTGQFSIISIEAAPILFKTSATERMRIDSSGNVGIGTTTPNAMLHVTDSIQVDGGDTFGVDNAGHQIYMSSGGSGLGGEFGTGYARNLIKSDGSATIHIGDNTSLISRILLDAGSAGTSGYISLQTKQVERVRVTADGNVGIGTTSPSGKLTVYAPNGNSDSLQIGRADSGSLWKFNHAGADLRIYNTDGSGSDILLGVDAAGTFHNNKVGIGTATPQQNLDVVGAARSTYDSSNYSQLESNASGGVFKALAAGATNILLRSYGDSYFNGGGLGVGTTSPTKTLDVNGNALISGGLQVTLSAGEEFKINPANTDREWYIDTTNADHLKKERNMVFSADPDNVHASTSIGFRIDNSQMMQLNSSGNLGIGTTSQTEKLHVAGKISNDQFQIPNTAGTAGQVLQWPSSGTTLEWATPSGGGSSADTARFNHNFNHGSNSSSSWYYLPNNTLVEASVASTNDSSGIVALNDGYVSKVRLTNVDVNGVGGLATQTRIRVEVNGSVVYTSDYVSHGTLTQFRSAVFTLSSTDATFSAGNQVVVRFNADGIWYRSHAMTEHTYTA